MENKDSAKQKHRNRMVTDTVYQTIIMTGPSEKALERFRRRPYEGLFERREDRCLINSGNLIPTQN